jgi:hypothetical protein
VLAAFIVLFVCGLACGAAITTTVLHWRMHTVAPGQMGLSQLKAKLQLSPQQEQVVTKELDDYVKYYQNIEEEREDVAEHGKRRILSVLNPEQKKVFLEMFGAALPTKADSQQ